MHRPRPTVNGGGWYLFGTRTGLFMLRQWGRRSLKSLFCELMQLIMYVSLFFCNFIHHTTCGISTQNKRTLTNRYQPPPLTVGLHTANGYEARRAFCVRVAAYSALLHTRRSFTPQPSPRLFVVHGVVFIVGMSWRRCGCRGSVTAVMCRYARRRVPPCILWFADTATRGVLCYVAVTLAAALN